MAYRNSPSLMFLAKNSPLDYLLPNFPSIAVQAAKQTLQIPIPTNWCYLFLSILFQGTGAAFTAAMIQEIRVKVNGILLIQISGTQLDTMNQYYKWPAGANPDGNSANDFLLLIPFIRQNMRGAAFMLDNTNSQAGPQFGAFTPEDVEFETALNCGIKDPITQIAITQVILEVDLVNTNPTGMTAITASNKAKVLPASEDGPGALLFINKTGFNAANSTVNSIINGNGILTGDLNHAYIDALALFPPAGLPGQYQFWLNSQEILQRSSEENVFWQKSWGYRAPPSNVAGNMQIIDFCETGYADGVKYIAPQATNARLQFSHTVAEVIILIQRSIGFLG